MIGIFDSGSGGLTVLKAIRDRVPSADVVYFGDIKNAPYGEKNRHELSHLTVEALTLLKERGADRIVSACNSVSASLAVSLFDAFSIAPGDLIEMVGPTVASFKGSNARIRLCATPATIESDIYQEGFQMIGKEIDTVAISKLAGLIEFGASESEMRDAIRASFASLDWSATDVLILACTHYPLVMQLFRDEVPQTVGIFDPALPVAERVEKNWWPREAGDGKILFLLSKDSEHFRKLAGSLFDASAYSIEVLP